jgi:hypothetical protein
MVLAIMVAASGCATRHTSPTVASAAKASSLPGPPTVATVTCEQSTARMLTPVVAAQRDGVHFVVENRTGHTFYFVPVHIDDEAVDYGELASKGGVSIPPGTRDLIFVLPPGHGGVLCLSEGTSLPNARSQLLQMVAPFEVVDPDGIYAPIPSDLDCGGGHVTTHELYLPLEFTDPEMPLAVARERLGGLFPSDVLQRVGYPEQRHVWVQVIRGGRIVALINFGPAMSSTVASCDNSGIKPGPRPAQSAPPTMSSSPPPLEEFPNQVDPVEGGRYWPFYLAIAEEGSPEIEAAVSVAEQYGYAPLVRRLGCDEGAAEFYNLSDDLIAVAVYFTAERDAEWVGDAINMPQWFPTEVTTRCLD